MQHYLLKFTGITFVGGLKEDMGYSTLTGMTSPPDPMNVIFNHPSGAILFCCTPR